MTPPPTREMPETETWHKRFKRLAEARDYNACIAMLRADLPPPPSEASDAPERILAWSFGGRLRIAPVEHGPLEFANEYVRADLFKRVISEARGALAYYEQDAWSQDDQDRAIPSQSLLADGGEEAMLAITAIDAALSKPQYGSSQTPITPPEASGEVEALIGEMEDTTLDAGGKRYRDAALVHVTCDTIRRAITTLRNQDAEIGRLEGLLANATEIADEAATEWDNAPSGMKAGKIILALAGRAPGYRADTDEIHTAIRAALGSPK